MHDPAAHAAPATFDPARFLGRAPERDPTAAAFGFGRRVCPGAHLAVQSLFVNVARVLATLVVEPDPAAPVREVRYSSGVIRCVVYSFVRWGAWFCVLRFWKSTASIRTVDRGQRVEGNES